MGRLKMVTGVLAGAIARKRTDEALAAALVQVRQLSDQLHAENVYLRQEVRQTGFANTGGGAQRWQVAAVLEQVQQVAATDLNVLLLGETGSGKELIATQVHDSSSRRDRLMVRVNCAAIPSALIESELFGRERGAYTGALTRQIGRFELADRSTIFLDEIGEMPIELQVKLLRVLQDHRSKTRRRPHQGHVRVIAATHRDLDAMVQDGSFREDLYYRLNVFPSACCRSASAPTTSPCWSGVSSRSSRSDSASRLTASPGRAWPPCSSIRGRETCANSGTSWSAP